MREKVLFGIILGLGETNYSSRLRRETGLGEQNNPKSRMYVCARREDSGTQVSSPCPRTATIVS
jgi:hypothetical protein